MTAYRSNSEPDPDFHAWVLEQANRDDPVGDIARDYKTGTELEIHEPAESPDELIEILHEQGAIPKAIDAAVHLGEEWVRGQ